MGSPYIFIDGRYLDLAHDKLISGFFGVSGDIDFNTVRATIGGNRIYYYNSVDDELRNGETEEAMRERVRPTLERYEHINALSGFHVRYGSVTGRAIKKRRQKQVDVQLAVDALLHAFNRNMGDVRLIAGDLDFKPLVDALVTMGVPVTVWYEKTSAARELYRSADDGREITLRTAWQWSTRTFQEAHPLPSDSTGGDFPTVPATVERTGRWNGRKIQLFKGMADNDHWLFVRADRAQSSIWVRAQDLGLVERYFEVMYGKPNWNADI